MGKKTKEFDAYIAKSAPFAQPILKHLRTLVHRGCPDAEEILKWGHPHFDYKGMLCSMGAFKEHCVFGFWKASLLKDASGSIERGERTAMGHLGRITSMDELPSSAVIVKLVRQAAKLNDAGVKKPAPPKKAKKPLVVPAWFLKALTKKARATFDAFTYSHKKEYVEWVTEAKTEGTRTRRLETTNAWLEEGKSRNWKYM